MNPAVFSDVYRRERQRGLSKLLRRSRRRRLIAGVCGGIAERLGWPPAVVRILFVLGSLVPVLPGFLVYFVLWLVVPLEHSSARTSRV